METRLSAAAADLFVTPAWLAERLGSSDIVALDASFYLPNEGKDADALFAEAHIPGAVRFDVDKVADHSIALPHMLPDAETFASMAGALGLSDSMVLVVYDSSDLIGGARAWWMLTHYGAKHVHILEGGFKAWVAGDYPVETGASRRKPATFAARYDDSTVADADKVLAAATSGSAQIVDARAAPRFEGSAPEPRARPALRSYPDVPQRCLARDGRCGRAAAAREGHRHRPSRRPASISANRSSPVAVRASRPPC